MNIPGFDFHALRGFYPIRYTVHVNGPWCITFRSRKVMRLTLISNNTTSRGYKALAS
jgi:hypothetical protein